MKWYVIYILGIVSAFCIRKMIHNLTALAFNKTIKKGAIDEENHYCENCNNLYVDGSDELNFEFCPFCGSKLIETKKWRINNENL